MVRLASVISVTSVCSNQDSAFRGRAEFLDAPNVIGQSRSHRGRPLAKRLIRAAEIVKGHVKRNRVFHVRQRFAVSIGQAREAAKVHPHAQIGALDM